jgi:hypothetical protein
MSTNRAVTLLPSATKRFLIPSNAVVPMETFLQNAGREGCEGAILLAGRAHRTLPATAVLDFIVFPRQERETGAFGVAVEISNAEVLELTSLLSAHDRLLYAKIHSHPTEAFHSSTDDSNMLLQFDGALSVVVPLFGLLGLVGWPHCAGFRYTSDGWRFRPLAHEGLASLTAFVNDEEATILDRHT